jgi:hypothetical protein
LEQSLLEAIVGCFFQSDVHQAGQVHQNHDTVMRRFYVLLEDNPDRPFYILKSAQQSECRSAPYGFVATSTLG